MDFVKIILLKSDISQIIDGLTQRMLIWRATAEYIETGYPQSADCVEKCDDEQEAIVIAKHYKYIIDQIEDQMVKQLRNKKVLFFNLIHGRKEPNQEMDEWGFDGPILGPYESVHCTYCTHLRLAKSNGEIDTMRIYDDLVYYDNCFYGDWFISTDISLNAKACVYDLAKAEIPNSQ